MSDRPTVAGALKRADEAHQKILSHEELCALRYSQITKVLEELRGGDHRPQEPVAGNPTVRGGLRSRHPGDGRSVQERPDRMTDWLGLEPGEMWRLPGWFGGLLLGVAISWWRWRRPR